MPDELSKSTFKHPRGHLEPCAYCKREMRADVPSDHPLRATKDHYIPKSQRPKGDVSIIVMACYTCNQIKGDRFPEQWDRFMQRNPRWWEPIVRRRKFAHPPKPTPIPIAHSQYILKYGKKAYRQWVAEGCPAPIEMRALRPGEPIPAHQDPNQQAAFEAYAKKYRHVLRVPVE